MLWSFKRVLRCLQWLSLLKSEISLKYDHYFLALVRVFFQNESVKAVKAQTFPPGVRNGKAGVSRREIAVFDPQAWHLAGIVVLLALLLFVLLRLFRFSSASCLPYTAPPPLPATYTRKAVKIRPYTQNLCYDTYTYACHYAVHTRACIWS